MEPVAVEFPLRGEWIAPNTPGHRVPSFFREYKIFQDVEWCKVFNGILGRYDRIRLI